MRERKYLKRREDAYYGFSIQKNIIESYKAMVKEFKE